MVGDQNFQNPEPSFSHIWNP